MVKNLEKVIEINNLSWIAPGYKEWIMDLDKLRESFPDLYSVNWLKGKAFIEPEVEPGEELLYGRQLEYKTKVIFYIVPETLRSLVMPLETLPEIQESLANFKKDYPDPNKAAFIMMQFGETKAHSQIVEAIKRALDSLVIEILEVEKSE